MSDDALFDSWVAEVVGEEGGYSNNPADPGGETMWGITKRVAVAHGYQGEMRDLPRETAVGIYRMSYWDPLVGYKLPPLYMRVAAECAVNQGLHRAIELIEASKGQLDWFMADRALAYIADKGFATFGKGWLRRLFKELIV